MPSGIPCSQLVMHHKHIFLHALYHATSRAASGPINVKTITKNTYKFYQGPQPIGRDSPLEVFSKPSPPHQATNQDLEEFSGILQMNGHRSELVERTKSFIFVKGNLDALSFCPSLPLNSAHLILTTLQDCQPKSCSDLDDLALTRHD